MKPTVLNDRYRLTELIGAGGMATVYHGEDLLLERSVAVKFLREPYASDPDARERFLHEARAAGKLDHPNIVHVYDVGQDQDSRPYIVMELVPGEDLKTLIRRDAPLPVAEALALAREICAGVGQAHRQGTVHCDLKPQNILVTDEDQVKVVDFGIARAAQQDEIELEPLEVVWGSPHYLSPEQAQGKKPTPASDVYSIGVILYEMLTGVPPFHDPDPEVLALKHCREEPPPLTQLNPRVPRGLDWLVRKILSKEPAHRYRNAEQLGLALEQYVRHGQSATGPYTPVAAETPVVATRAAGGSSAGGAGRPEAARSPVHAGAGTSASHGGSPPEGTKVESEEGTQPIAVREGADTTLWMLMAVAAIAVIGLIPLWLFVYQAYTAPVVMPTPVGDETPRPATPGTEALVTVPNLTGLSAADAQRMAQSLGLEIEVLGEEESSDARPGAVLEQAPGPGARVTTDSTVSVILAAGRTLVMPDVIGYDLDTVQSGLESEGLLVATQEARSRELSGTVLEQEPEAQQEIRAGDTVTLTVSGGSDIAIPLRVNLNDQVILEQAWISDFGYRPGASVPVTLRWRCLAEFGASYKVFIHLVKDDTQMLVAQRDIVPVNGLRPTTSWTPGETISDPHQISLPELAPPGTYQIRVGLYSDSGRLPVLDAGEARVVDDTIFVTTVTVQP